MEWFLLNAGRVEGPIHSSEVIKRLSAGELDENVLICKQGDPHWRPLNEFKEQIFDSAQPDETHKPWILLTENLSLAPTEQNQGQFVQSGPYNTAGIKALIQSGEVKYSDFVWKEGMEKWTRINEVDEFFIKAKEQVESPTPEIETDRAKPEEILSNVFQQTALNNDYQFLDEQAPEESNKIDETKIAPLQPKFEINEADSQGAVQFKLQPEPVTELKENFDDNRINNDSPVKESANTDLKNILEKAPEYFPYLMTGMAAILALMVGVWGISVFMNQRQDPPPAALKTLPDEEKKTSSTTVPAQTPTKAAAIKSETSAPRPRVVKKVVPSRKVPAEDRRLSLATKRLISKAERLEREFSQLKNSPLDWRRFYQDFQNDLRKTNELVKKIDSPMARSIRQGTIRLEDRAQMMDRAITKSVPMSSDFERENLPEMFRGLQKQKF